MPPLLRQRHNAALGLRCNSSFDPRTWTSEGFFPGWPPGDFPNIFSRGAQSGEIYFFPLKTKKQPFFAEKFKIQGGGLPPLPMLMPLQQLSLRPLG